MNLWNVNPRMSLCCCWMKKLSRCGILSLKSSLQHLASSCFELRGLQVGSLKHTQQNRIQTIYNNIYTYIYITYVYIFAVSARFLFLLLWSSTATFGFRIVPGQFITIWWAHSVPCSQNPGSTRSWTSCFKWGCPADPLCIHHWILHVLSSTNFKLSDLVGHNDVQLGID